MCWCTSLAIMLFELVVFLVCGMHVFSVYRLFVVINVIWRMLSFPRRLTHSSEYIDLAYVFVFMHLFQTVLPIHVFS